MSEGIEFFMDFATGRAELQLHRLEELDKAELLESLAQLGEQQTKRRISSEKTSPDGEAWPAWSDAYASSRHSGQSLLYADGSLAESITSTAPSGDGISWGSDLIYAGVHNFGHTFDSGIVMPERRYLGVSADNAREMESVAYEFLGSQLQ